MLNHQILEALHGVRNRQIPWHKKASLFMALGSLGLIEPGREKKPIASTRVGLDIAVLSDFGRSEFERLKGREHQPDWDSYQHAVYGV